MVKHETLSQETLASFLNQFHIANLSGVEEITSKLSKEELRELLSYKDNSFCLFHVTPQDLDLTFIEQKIATIVHLLRLASEQGLLDQIFGPEDKINSHGLILHYLIYLGNHNLVVEFLNMAKEGNANAPGKIITMRALEREKYEGKTRKEYGSLERAIFYRAMFPEKALAYFQIASSLILFAEEQGILPEILASNKYEALRRSLIRNDKSSQQLLLGLLSERERRNAIDEALSVTTIKSQEDLENLKQALLTENAIITSLLGERQDPYLPEAEISLGNTAAANILRAHLWNPNQAPTVTTALKLKLNCLLGYLPQIRHRIKQDYNATREIDKKERHLLIAHLFSTNCPSNVTEEFKIELIKLMLYLPYIRGIMQHNSTQITTEIDPTRSSFISHLHTSTAPNISDEFKQEIAHFLTLLPQVNDIFASEENPQKKEIEEKLIPHLFFTDKIPLPLSFRLEFAELLANWEHVMTIADKEAEKTKAKTQEAKAIVHLTTKSFNFKNFFTKLWSCLSHFGISLSAKRKAKITTPAAPITPETSTLISGELDLLTDSPNTSEDLLPLDIVPSVLESEVLPAISTNTRTDNNQKGGSSIIATPAASSHGYLAQRSNLIQQATAIFYNNYQIGIRYFVTNVPNRYSYSCRHIRSQPTIFKFLCTRPDTFRHSHYKRSSRTRA